MQHIFSRLDTINASVSLERETYSWAEGKNWICKICASDGDSAIHSTKRGATAQEALAAAYQTFTSIQQHGIPLAKLAPALEAPPSQPAIPTNEDIPF